MTEKEVDSADEVVDSADEVSETPSEAKPPPKDEGGGRRRAVIFVTLFAVYVLAILMGYRYSIKTEANMWYLFQVGNHTALLLDLTGAQGLVEPEGHVGRICPGLLNPAGEGGAAKRSSFGSAQVKRAKLRTWRGSDEDNGNSGDEEPKSAPLTPWETWLYKAYSRLNGGGTIQNFGPLVHFVAKRGLTGRIADTHRLIRAMRKDAALNAKPDTKRLKRLEAELTELIAREQALPRNPEGNAERKDNTFDFIVVPDCGAIPLMSIFIAAVLAFPTRWRKRLFGVAVGVPVLYFVNLVRLSTLAYIGAIDTTPGLKWFNFSHEYVWQGIFLVFVAAFWMCWIEFVVRGEDS